MNELKIKGHSGCGLRVVEDSNGNLLVEKSCKESYIPRLKSQYEKQLEASLFTRSFNVPQPTWANDKMLMPYINAMSFIEYFERAGKSDIDTLVNDLYTYIETEKVECKYMSIDTEVFISKVQSVCKNTKDNPVLTIKDKELVEKRCEYVINYIKQLGDTIDMYVGKCHGDLTFSNILFRGSGKHSLIDFLDSFVETPLQDLVKIRQDTKYGWSLLMSDASYNKAHVKTVMDYIDKHVVGMFDSEFLKHYDMMQYINILRIVPYVKEKEIFNYLIKILNTIEL